MELRQLRYFVAVAEHRHFGRAAQQLHIVQPAVSQQVQRLERELGLPLLDRTTRRVNLTSAGERFLDHAREVIDAADRAQAAMRLLRAESPAELRLGTTTGLGGHLARALDDFTRRRPGVRVELLRLPEEERLARVSAGDLHAAFVRRRADVAIPRGLVMADVLTDPLVAALPQDATSPRRRTVRLAELAPLSIRLPERQANPLLVDAVTQACRQAGFEPRLGPAGDDQDTLALIAAGRSSWTVFFSPKADLLERQGLPGVAFRRIAAPRITIVTALAYRRAGGHPAVADLADAVRATFAPLSSSDLAQPGSS
ncbi:LysR family transcriptional regulator [Frankia sp. AgB1.9]|uniref:LysR family transcriptional regulator n=1 Tax=unclassified Frankia TaxID=2632575 RepID=UPI001932C51D|nr:MULTISPECIES: LysR family transcriptional regulator [unclassified Frankia]MBL7491618.1 LysR family transcriptional regulator [Frankia sp. AgW1.1]MBL7553837.1 LysR family transcriptional regulator [Frankia sp. AgB1.9]MBL7618082.1 LysR family transcriptional regulator [Frankia sp. AgB1.8]